VKLITKKQEPIVLDAAKYTYGRLCAKISNVLLGKFNIYYSSNNLTGSVLINNLDDIKFSGKNKTHQIKYYYHSGYAKGLKIKTLYDSINEGKLLDHLRVSIYKMMPKTHFTKQYIYKNVKMYQTKNGKQ
jgi:large subunit ribosomal protein L13